MTPTDSQLQRALTFDPLANAERMTGQSYKDDEGTMALGFLSHIEHGDRKRRMLRAVDDTELCNQLGNYQRIIGEEGFEQVLAIPFAGRAYKDDAAPAETFFAYFHPRDGILLAFDTYQSTRVNGGNFYYNLRSKGDSRIGHATSSGCWHSPTGDRWADWTPDWVWTGGHDCREALRFHLRQLREVAEFVTPWLYDPRPRMVHHMDTDDLPGETWGVKMQRFDRIIAERLSMLPAHVQAAVAVSLEGRTAAAK